MKEKIPLNLVILKWARESMGLTIDDVAKKFAKQSTEIESWERGDSSPTYSQLEKLAYDIYIRPIAIFFFPEIPPEPKPKADFRTLPETILQNLPTEIIKVYRKAKVLQINLEELYEGKRPINDSILSKFQATPDMNIVELCNDVRSVLKISINDQINFKDADIAFKSWRSSLEENGIFVFKDAFHEENYSGFCLHSDLYPVIIINNSMPFSRQVFTLFHELCHLLFKTGGIDFREKEQLLNTKFPGKRIEIICNRFANKFLLPEDAMKKESTEISEKNLTDLANKYKISREVILRNFIDRLLIDERQYDEFVDKWKRKEKKKTKENQ